MAEAKLKFAALMKEHEKTLLVQWTEEQVKALGSKVSQNELKTQCKDFLSLFIQAAQADPDNVNSKSWEPTRKMLDEISRARTYQGFTPGETATFVFSLKRPVVFLMRKVLSDKPQEFADEIWALTEILDQLGLYTAEVHQKSREEVITRQQEEMLELSTPVVKLWDGILALPMIGTLDSSRTQVVMESLLQKIMETGSEIAIIDITGVPTVDTLVAQHLIKTVTAARLMGAECLISGIRPQIAATIVHLGVDLGDVTTKASLADAFAVALNRMGRGVTRVASSEQKREIRA